MRQQEWIAVSAALVAAIVLFFGGSIWNFFSGGTMPDTSSSPLSGVSKENKTPSNKMENVSLIPGIEIYDIQVGTGPEAVAGKTVVAHYIGILADGTKFDSSVERGQPFEFKLGAGQVIRGWDVGIAGMKAGGIRRLVVSPDLGYGAQAIGPIPANSTLIFEVQLLDVK